MRVKSFIVFMTVLTVLGTVCCRAALPVGTFPSTYEQKVKKDGLVGHHVGSDGKNVKNSGAAATDPQDKDKQIVTADGQSLREKNLAWVKEFNAREGLQKLEPKLMDLDKVDYAKIWKANEEYFKQNSWMQLQFANPYVKYEDLNLPAYMAMIYDMPFETSDGWWGCQQASLFGFEQLTNGRSAAEYMFQEEKQDQIIYTIDALGNALVRSGVYGIAVEDGYVLPVPPR